MLLLSISLCLIHTQPFMQDGFTIFPSSDQRNWILGWNGKQIGWIQRQGSLFTARAFLSYSQAFVYSFFQQACNWSPVIMAGAVHVQPLSYSGDKTSIPWSSGACLVGLCQGPKYTPLQIGCDLLRVWWCWRKTWTSSD